MDFNFMLLVLCFVATIAIFLAPQKQGRQKKQSKFFAIMDYIIIGFFAAFLLFAFIAVFIIAIV